MYLYYIMLSKENRILYFIIGCIGIRIIFAYIPIIIPKLWLPTFGLLTSIIGASFLYLYIFNKRMNAPEGGGSTGWAKYRLIHGLLYICASIYLFQQQRIAWIPLTMDVVLGFSLFLNQHI